MKLGLVAAAGVLSGVGRARDRVALRLGLVLPARSHRTLLQADDHGVAAEAALRGAMLAGENPAFSSLLGGDLEVLPGIAPNPDAAARVAHRLCALENVTALIGGHGSGQSAVLSSVAAEYGVPFFNLSKAGNLRHALTFHMEPDRETYLRTVAGWHADQGPSRWLAVHDRPDDELIVNTLQASGAAEPETMSIPAGRAALAPVLSAALRLQPEVILLDLPWLQQLDILEQFEGTGVDAAVTVIPDAVAQTREFLATARDRAPGISSNTVRAAVWDASIDSELNDRFEGRWGVPMDPPAWTAWQAVRILAEAVSAAGSRQGDVLAAHLRHTQSDMGKSVPATFHPETQQLQQSLFLIRVRPDEPLARQLAEVISETDLN